ncbi:hypothetical protein ACFFLM_08935, partial [Deinococcus oregonensis]
MTRLGQHDGRRQLPDPRHGRQQVHLLAESSGLRHTRIYGLFNRGTLLFKQRQTRLTQLDNQFESVFTMIQGVLTSFFKRDQGNDRIPFVDQSTQRFSITLRGHPAGWMHRLAI